MSPRWSAVLLFVVGCGSAAGNLPVGSYERGVAEMEKDHYYEAVEDLKLFVRRNPTDAKVDEAQYQIGLARYKDGDYPVAAVEFEILRTDYPNSARVEDAWYMEGMCYRKQMPSIERDQTITKKALDHFHRYVQQFPQGSRHDEAMQQIDELQRRLDRKRMDAAALYDHLGRPKAALVTLQALLQDRGDSALLPEMLYRMGRLSQRLHDGDGAREYWQRAVDAAPDSEFGRRARKALARLAPEGGENGSAG